MKLGDITAGQVFVEVVDVNGHTRIHRKSLRNQEFTSFDLNGNTVYLGVKGMVNHLIGEDICKVHVTYTKPTREEAGKVDSPEKTD